MKSNLGVATTHIVATVLSGPFHGTRVFGSRSIFHSRKSILHLSKEVISPLLVRGPLGQLLDCIELLLHREDSALPVIRHIQVSMGVVSHDFYALASEL